jgi:hypothetical protein
VAYPKLNWRSACLFDRETPLRGLCGGGRRGVEAGSRLSQFFALPSVSALMYASKIEDNET